MSFTTKKYTINLLVNEVASLSNTQVSSVQSLANSISPRAGVSSAKFYALNRYVGGNITAVINGRGRFSSFGKTARSRILTALRARKNS